MLGAVAGVLTLGLCIWLLSELRGMKGMAAGVQQNGVTGNRAGGTWSMGTAPLGGRAASVGCGPGMDEVYDDMERRMGQYYMGSAQCRAETLPLPSRKGSAAGVWHGYQNPQHC